MSCKVAFEPSSSIFAVYTSLSLCTLVECECDCSSLIVNCLRYELLLCSKLNIVKVACCSVSAYTIEGDSHSILALEHLASTERVRLVVVPVAIVLNSLCASPDSLAILICNSDCYAYVVLLCTYSEIDVIVLSVNIVLQFVYSIVAVVHPVDMIV